MKRKAAPAAGSSNDGRRVRIERSLLASGACPKSTLARILCTLHAEGFLADGLVDDGDSEEHVRKSIAAAARGLGTQATPFGPVVQEMTLNTTPPFTWQYIHPVALVYSLSQASPGFATMMGNCIDASSGPLGIVLFVDEARPGNVLRPDKGRAVQNIYWAFSEWPEWYLSRADAWLNFGCLRSNIVAQLPGGMSGLMVQILHRFFNTKGPNFAVAGGMIDRGPLGAVVFKARLAGLLGDEKGLKEVFGAKGPNATRPCLSCKNICQFMDEALGDGTYLQSVRCPDRSKFDPCSDAEVYEAADILR